MVRPVPHFFFSWGSSGASFCGRFVRRRKKPIDRDRRNEMRFFFFSPVDHGEMLSSLLLPSPAPAVAAAEDDDDDDDDEEEEEEDEFPVLGRLDMEYDDLCMEGFLPARITGLAASATTGIAALFASPSGLGGAVVAVGCTSAGFAVSGVVGVLASLVAATVAVAVAVVSADFVSAVVTCGAVVVAWIVAVT